jgi:hypothetical protein
VDINGIHGSLLSLVSSSLFKKVNKPFLFLFEDKEEAAYYLNDLENLLGDKSVLFIQALTADRIKLKRLTMPMFFLDLKS